jgi:methylenetetrahydrofolate dehydrogenase (NADP+) / methenyltetrahydrofolate cyclohydrolase
MAATLIDGKALAAAVREDVATQVHAIIEQGKRAPGLAVVLVGQDSASQIYVKHKRTACKKAGVTSFEYNLEAATTQDDLLELIAKLNVDDEVDGVLVQLPLPKHIKEESIVDAINPKKDVDGFHPYNIGCLAQRRPAIRPCTPFGVIHMLESINFKFKGSNAVVIGSSSIVGRPMALELLLSGATVTVCHRFTKDIAEHISRADLVVSAVGKPGLVKGEWIKQGAVVVDVGITRLADGTLSGDVDFDAACERASYITPVPGGVGPMTVAMLLQNTLAAYVVR